MAYDDTTPAKEVVLTETLAPPPLQAKDSDPELQKEPQKLIQETHSAEKEKKNHSGGIPLALAFKEESNFSSDLPELEKKVLEELKQLLQSAITNREFSPSESVLSAVTAFAEAKPEESPVSADDDGAKTVKAIAETVVSATIPPPAEEEKIPLIWGIPLLGDERSNTILLKFLRARDFKAKEAMTMIKNTLTWRRDFGIEALLEEDLGLSEIEKVVFMSGVDREGHPVCYNAYGQFQNKELYAKAFADEKQKGFLRWRIQYLEKGIRQLLNFRPGGISTMIQVTDLKNSPGPLKRDFPHALGLLLDNYPEFVAKQLFLHVPWWYLAVNKMISPFLTQRTKSKFVFAGPSKSAEVLFRYVAPEQVPLQFGGLYRENNPDFTISDAVTEINIKPSTKEILEVPLAEPCLLIWELRVLGWDVSYGAEFVPNSKESYTIIVHKARKMAASDELVVKNSFRVGEPGKILFTVENSSNKRKMLLYRYNVKTTEFS
ncbi:patellin-3-like [Phalaenopsis equestris]|uniref:patellin-3-like n=1 Tax=Phalaenopsis equestris TaxID=78828 RepID=UPI0009E3C08D|nr:patellin-3-like [Phalaenopsis equestris]